MNEVKDYKKGDFVFVPGKHSGNYELVKVEGYNRGTGSFVGKHGGKKTRFRTKDVKGKLNLG